MSSILNAFSKSASKYNAGAWSFECSDHNCPASIRPHPKSEIQDSSALTCKKRMDGYRSMTQQDQLPKENLKQKCTSCGASSDPIFIFSSIFTMTKFWIKKKHHKRAIWTRGKCLHTSNKDNLRMKTMSVLEQGKGLNIHWNLSNNLTKVMMFPENTISHRSDTAILEG